MSSNSDEMEARVEEGKAKTGETRTDIEERTGEARADIEANSSKNRADQQQRLYEARGEAEQSEDRLGQMLDKARTRDADAAASPKGLFARIKARFTGGQ